MAQFNQLTLCNILNGRNNLGTPELRAAVAAMTDEQRDDALVFLECNTEELAGLPDGCGIQAIANARNLLDYLPSHTQAHFPKELFELLKFDNIFSDIPIFPLKL